jgi:hypothetical protein
MRRRRCGIRITCHLSLVTVFSLFGTGCTQTYQTFSAEQGGSETSYVTFEHPFTDAGAEEARKRAERQCGYKKQTAIKTKSTCSLSRCTTSFQCMLPAEAAKYPTGGEK